MSAGKVIIETARLILREFTEDDAPAFLDLNRRPEVVRYTGDGGMTSVEDALARLREAPLSDYRTRGFGRWAVIHKADQTFIGFIGLKYLSDLNDVDLGYRLLPEYWGQGLAVEGSLPVLKYGFDILRLPHILGLIDPANDRSRRVLEKLGFVFDRPIEYRGEPADQYRASPPPATSYA